MTEKEKAVELYRMYNSFGKLNDSEVKECALLSVDEIIDAIDWHQFEVPNDQLKFWFNVKKEIEKL